MRLIIGLVLLLSTLSVRAEIEVLQFVDKNSAGWAYKKNDLAFVVDKADCKIQWNTIEEKTGNRYLRLRRRCALSFSEQIPIHRAILQEIHKHTALDRFSTIIWGMFCDRTDMSWCKTVAQLSLTSADYIDYWRHYPNSRLKSPNPIFVRLANDSHSYKPLSTLFNEFGVKVRLENVEKVFAQRYEASPFKGELKVTGPDKNPRIMFNVGMAYFKISK